MVHGMAMELTHMQMRISKMAEETLISSEANLEQILKSFCFG